MKILKLLLLCTLSLTAHAYEGILPLSGVSPALPDEELNVLTRMIHGTEVMVIGESAHGSSGYRQMHHRLAKYLIEKKGFRLLMIENPVIRSAGMTIWLNNCSSSEAPIDLLTQPIDEDLKFFQWLCSFNKAHPSDKVVYRGMDIWDRPWEHQVRMEALNQKLNLGFAELLKPTHDHCWFHNQNSWSTYNDMMKILAREKKIPEADYLPCTQSLGKMLTSIQKRIDQTPAYARFPLYTFQQSLQTSFAYQADFNFAYQDRGLMWDARDLGQANNELSIWKQEGQKKAIIITHNSHATKMGSPSNWWGFGLGKIHSNIYFLKKILGEKVKVIGLTGYEVTGTQGEFLIPTSAESLDVQLHKMNIPVAYIDPRSSFMLSQKMWWIHNENNPSAYPDGVYLVPKDHFDALIFIDKTLKGNEILPARPIWNW